MFFLSNYVIISGLIFFFGGDELVTEHIIFESTWR